MPASPASAALMELTSDYPMEKVVYVSSGSFTLAASTTSAITSINHGLPFIPLVGGGWSLSSNFAEQYSFASGTVSATSGIVYDQEVRIFADSTKIYFESDNYVAASKTIYYRVFGLQPSTDSSSLETTATQGDVFTIDTTYQLQKVFASGTIDLPATGGTEAVVDVTHNLGFAPLASGWHLSDTYNGVTTVSAMHPIGTTQVSGNGVLFVVASNDVVRFINNPGQLATTCHYRLYG